MATRPGVGLIVLGSPRTVFRDPNGTATYNDAAARRCFDPYAGTLVVPRDSDLYAAAFLGGDRRFANSRPQIGAEMQFIIGARVLAQAFAAGRPSFEGLPFEWDHSLAGGDYDGQPTDFDMLAFCYIANPDHPFVAKWFAAGGDPQGQTPDNPFIADPTLRFPEAERGDADRTLYQFFTIRNPVGATVYYRYPGAATRDIYGYKRGYPEGSQGPSERPATGSVPAKPTTDPEKPKPNDPVKPPVDPTSADGYRQRLLKARILAQDFLTAIPKRGGGAPLQAFRKEVREVLERIIDA